MVLSFSKKLSKRGQRGQGGQGFLRKLRQLAKLLEEALIKGQASSRSFDQKGAKGAKQPHVSPRVGLVYSSWHSWHASCLKKAKRCYRPKREVTSLTDRRPAIWSADRPLVLRNHGRCQQLMASDAKGRPMACGDDQQAIPYPSKQKHKYLVQNQMQDEQVERS